MNAPFFYADVHCHPNLKTFGHSFAKKHTARSSMWHTVPASYYRKMVHRLTGITKFSQTDFTTMAHAGGRVAFMSLYPFEKGFFTHKRLWPPLAARLADWGIEIGYNRIRYLQQHTDYFADLQAEYRFVQESAGEKKVNGQAFRWQLTRNWADVAHTVAQQNTIAVVLTIEGAHVFNSGLQEYGVPVSEEAILANVAAVKQWEHVPLFIGLTHNFNNDLCGHARSLQRLGKLVNQEHNLGAGILPAGKKVIQALLDAGNSRPIYIDLKHMSLAARMQYYALLEEEYATRRIPLIASHASVTGRCLSGARSVIQGPDIFNTSDLNFFDEEIVRIAQSGGIIGLQMDLAVHTDVKKIKQYWQQIQPATAIQKSAQVIWKQLQHVAAVCDRNGLSGWDCCAVGSDFDGSIYPLPGVLTAAGLESLAKELVPLANGFLAGNYLQMPQNRRLIGEEIVSRFMYGNTIRFLQEFYPR
jgi:microsomal dipeptidase-like Zn-dependent dipeptidase